MRGWIELHRLAQARGDGFRPKLLELLQQAAEPARYPANVIDLARRRGDVHIQAGPDPLAAVLHQLPDNVIAFPTVCKSADTLVRPKPVRRRGKASKARRLTGRVG
jgi:hypothetical protein